MSEGFDNDTSTLSDDDREILAFWMKQERQQKLLAQQIIPRQSKDDPPLSFAQQRLWVVEQMADTGAAYNLSMGLRISGPLRIDLLEKSLGEILRRHEVLRSSIDLKDGEPVQVVHPPTAVKIEFTDLSEASAEKADSGIRKFYAEASETVFDLARGPLMRIHLLRKEQQEHILVICMHHIITDGWSFSLLRREFSVLYEAYLSGSSSPLPELKVQYADYATWQRSWLAGDEYKRQLDYWREQLRDLTTLELPNDRFRPALPSFQGGMASISIDAELKQSLVKLARREDVTLFILMLAVFNLLLHKYSGQDDIVLGSPVANRSRIETEELIGFFVNMLVLRTNLSGNPSFRELLARVRDMAFEAYAHQDLPIEQMVDELKIVRDMSRNPLFQVSFALQEKPEEAGQQVGDLSLNPASAGNPAVRFDLELFVTDGAQDLSVLAVFNTDLFDADTIERMLLHYRNLLTEIVANPDYRLGELELLSAQEHQRLVGDWNQTRSDYPREQTVQALFEAQAAATPDAIALDFDSATLSYAELNRRANRLAHYLRVRGVGAETKVGLFIKRNIDMVVAALGIVKAGGAYLPMDLDYPAPRLAFMLEDAGVPLLVSTSNLATRLPEGTYEEVCLDSDWAQIEQASADNPEIVTSADSLAYVIYTSGSTGTPKGVEIVHRSINRLVRNTDYYQVDATDRIAQASSISFDAATFELWGALLNGAQLIGVSKATLLNSKALAAMLQEKGVTAMFITTAVFNQIAREQPDAFKGLRGLMFGGEAVDPVAVRRVLASQPPERLLHVYGPTESTTFATWYPIESLADEATTVPIGRPLANTTVYVLDANRQPVPVGVSGELYIGGDGLARGYLNQPELTSERFVANPFEAHERLYRTGDKVRNRDDGSIEFQGRFDHQVKLRGFRIELGEIETALQKHAAVQDAVAMMHQLEPGDNRLVAYLVTEGDSAPTVAEIRELMRAHLPEYMVPAAFVMLDKLPLTANGKVDRRALPAPQNLEAQAQGYAPPRSELEQQLAQIWGDVLKLQRVGIHDNFFDLGGHSLKATQVMSRIREQLNVELPLSKMFGYPTVAGLAPLVETLQEESDGAEADAIPVIDRDDNLPLSFAQERLWYLDQLAQGSPFYNMSLAIRLQGQLNLAALVDSLKLIVARHDTLRTRFSAGTDQPLQLIDSDSTFDLLLETIPAIENEAGEQALADLIRDESLQPFDLEKDSLVRARLVHLAEDEHILLVTLHHIISDGWSLGVLFRELGDCYAAFSKGKQPRLVKLPIQYADFTAWQRNWLSGDILASQLDYWRQQLDGLSVLELPTDHPRPAVQTFNGASDSYHLPRKLGGELERFSQQQRVSLYITLLAAFAGLMHRYSGQEDIVIGSPVANRNRAELEGLIGFFVNSLVMRTDVSGNPSFMELVQRANRTALGAYDHQDLPFEKLVDELQPERDLGQNPLIQIMFALQNAPMEPLELEGLKLQVVASETEVTRFDLEVHIWQGSECLLISFIYNTDLFDAATIRRLFAHYRSLLEAMVTTPDMRIGEAPMLGERERQQVVIDWNQTKTDYPREQTVPMLFEAQALQTPDACAVEYDGGSLSYAQLNQRANRLAHYLIDIGVKADAAVVVLMERTPNLIIAQLAVLKSAAAYVAIDPDNPSQRMGFILQDTQSPLLLTQSSLVKRVSGYAGRTLCLDSNDDILCGQSTDNPAARATAENLAYVIYTSGSTGKPKGVEVGHGGLTNLVKWHQRAYEVGPDDRATHLAGLGFDASVWELWPYLTCGASLYLVSDEKRLAPAGLWSLMAAQGITLSFLPTPLAEAVLCEPVPKELKLRVLLTGGDRLHGGLLNKPVRFRIVNHYGPTENSVVTTSSDVDVSAAQDPPIGRPIDNVQTYILDKGLEPVPVGVWGELYIGGESLARGYLNQPQLTAETFIPNPFSDSAGARLYRSGDLVRYRADGQIEFRGRIDHQVKLRGFRVELGEIETVLLNHEALQDAVAMVREDEPGDKRIAAYLVMSPQWVEQGLGSQSGEHVDEWQTLYDEAYGNIDAELDMTANFTGWNSSYTGEPIPLAEMEEWQAATIARITALQPHRVLEIGCGTGLLLLRLAPACERYVGTDFSAVAQAQVQGLVSTQEDYKHVELWHRSADEFSGIDAGDFDLVVINSVVQYLPSVDYLLEVLSGAVAGVGDGGHVFVGDLRSFPLLSAYHASVEAHRAPQDVTGLELLDSVQQRVEEENELVVEPAFFHALKQRIPRISHVEVLLKRGEHINELSAFRYDVILHVEAQPTALASTGQWHDWGISGYSEAALKALLAPLDQDWLGIHAIPNARYARELALLEQLQGQHAALALPDLQVEIEARVTQAIDPARLWRLAESCGYELELGYAGSGADGRMEAMFRRGARTERADKLFWDQAQTPGERCWTDYTNNPLKGGPGHELIPQLKEDLQQSLPNYMVPSTFVFLDTLPVTPSGKVDRKALPRPQLQQPKRVSSNRPETEMEIILAEIWEELLEMEVIETDDMFFDLGGHSLLTIKVIDRFARQTNVRIPVASFMSQTLRQIAASAEACLAASDSAPGKEPDTLADKDSKKGSGRGFLGLFKK